MKKPSKQIDLGTLPPFEYEMLRAALNYAVEHCRWAAERCEASTGAGEVEQRQYKILHLYWRDQASEMRALRARFRKAGRA